MKKVFLQGVVLLVLGGYSALSAASCSWQGISEDTVLNMNLENLRIPNILPVGSVLLRKTFDLPAGSRAARCDPTASVIVSWLGLNMIPVLFENEVLYSLSRQGVALRVVVDPVLFPAGTALPKRRTLPGITVSKDYIYEEWGRSITFEIVKTRPVVVPGLMFSLGAVYPGIRPAEDTITVVGGARYNFVGNGTVVAGSCFVTSKDVAIDLGDISRSAFPAGGGPVPGARDVASSIDLVCDAGTPAKVTLDGAIASGRPTILSTTSAGVGVELLLKGNPVTYGSKIDLGIIASDGPFKIPLTARYYGTGGAVTRGPLTANATFTFDFL